MNVGLLLEMMNIGSKKWDAIMKINKFGMIVIIYKLRITVILVKLIQIKIYKNNSPIGGHKD